MREAEKILKAIYRLVKGDSSPIYLPVSPTTAGAAAGIPADGVLASCKILESHGYLTSTQTSSGQTYFYITKMGISEAQKPSLLLLLLASFTSQGTRNASSI